VRTNVLHVRSLARFRPVVQMLRISRLERQFRVRFLQVAERGEKTPSHYELLLITESVEERQSRDLRRRVARATRSGFPARASVQHSERYPERGGSVSRRVAAQCTAIGGPKPRGTPRPNAIEGDSATGDTDMGASNIHSSPLRAVRVVPIAGQPLLVCPNQRTYSDTVQVENEPRARAPVFATEEGRSARDRCARPLD
jgi:hypothetical protein